MNDYFEREFLALERELLRLKTSAQRSSGTVVTTKTVQPISVQLVDLNTYCRGYTYYVIEPETDSIVNITLDWYYEDVSKEWQVPRVSRSFGVNKIIQPSGKIILEFYAYGTTWSTDNSDDLSRLRNGETVIITANATIQSTNEFTIRSM